MTKKQPSHLSSRPVKPHLKKKVDETLSADRYLNAECGLLHFDTPTPKGGGFLDVNALSSFLLRKTPKFKM
jgi:hypothetical protein